MKKFVSLLVSILMILSLFIPATAVESDTIIDTDLSTDDTGLYIVHEKEKK